jgi:Zn-dependent M16 (insulinase) family peptidase
MTLLLQMRSQLESSKGNAFSFTVISDFLYGAMDGSDLHSSMDEVNQYATLRSWSSQKWTNLLSQ